MASNGDRLEGLPVILHGDTKKFKYFRASSKERSSGTASSFNMLFGNDPLFDQVQEIHLISASVLNCADNVSQSKGNSTFTSVATIAGNINFQVPDGFYTTVQLMAEIQSQINAIIAPSTIAITQNPITNKITFTITGAETIDFQASPTNPMGGTIGILADSGATAAFTTQGYPSLNGDSVFYIHSQEIARNVTYIGGNGNVRDVNGMAMIPITVGYGLYQNYQPIEEDRIVYGRTGIQLKGFNITIRGNGGRELVELQNGDAETVLTFKMFYG
jgi:hypothetical protein